MSDGSARHAEETDDAADAQVSGPGEGAEPDRPAAGHERARSQLLGLVRATHPRQAVAVALAFAVVAALTGRSGKEIVVTALAGLVVQLFLGLVNDLCDEASDRAAGFSGKPLAEGTVARANATWLALVLLLVSIPLALQVGTVAGLALLATVVVGAVHDRWLHRGVLSWLGWTVTFALYPAFLAYGGWGGGRHGHPPTVAITVVAAVLGLCTHFLTALPDLVGDHEAGSRSLPLRIALRTGAPRLLTVTSVVTVAACVALAAVALGPGLRQ